MDMTLRDVSDILNRSINSYTQKVSLKIRDILFNDSSLPSSRVPYRKPLWNTSLEFIANLGGIISSPLVAKNKLTDIQA